MAQESQFVAQDEVFSPQDAHSQCSKQRHAAPERCLAPRKAVQLR